MAWGINMAGKATEIKLDFVFTSEGFILDICDGWEKSSSSKVIKQFFEDKYLALYNMGLSGKPEKSSVAAGFLYFVADTFFKELVKLPT